MTVAGIIQVRMTSSRFPGKVLREVLGRPLLAWQIERLRACRRLDRLIVATTLNAADDPVTEVARNEGAEIFRGDEHDVLDRMCRAAAPVCRGSGIVVRLTGDCPFVDPGVVDAVVERLEVSGADYARTSGGYPEGLDCEAVRLPALKAAWMEAEEPPEREHVTLFIRHRPERFHCVELPAPHDDGDIRVTVDEPEDFIVVERVLKELVPIHGPLFGLAPLRRLYRERPDIFEPNRRFGRNEGLVKSLRDAGTSLEEYEVFGTDSGGKLTS